MNRTVKRILLAIGGAVLVVVFALGGVMVSAFAGRSAIREGVVGGFVHIVKDGIVSADVIETGANQVALIDAGNDPQGKAILAELDRMKLTPDAVTAIFFTHGHTDHTAATHLFPKAKVYALAADIPLAEGREGGHGFLTRMIPVKPTGITVTGPLNDGDVVQVGSRAIHVFAIPGHTGGSAAYWVDGVLFLGDSAGSSNAGELLPSPAAFSDSPAQNRQSLKGLAARLRSLHLNIDTIVPAHSGWVAGPGPLDRFALTH